MILNKKLKTLLVLALYVGFTIAIYAIVCHFIDKPFSGDSFAVCSTDRMHRLFAGVYCGEKEINSLFGAYIYSPYWIYISNTLYIYAQYGEYICPPNRG